MDLDHGLGEGAGVGHSRVAGPLQELDIGGSRRVLVVVQEAELREQAQLRDPAHVLVSGGLVQLLLAPQDSGNDVLALPCLDRLVVPGSAWEGTGHNAFGKLLLQRRRLFRCGHPDPRHILGLQARNDPRSPPGDCIFDLIEHLLLRQSFLERAIVALREQKFARDGVVLEHRLQPARVVARVELQIEADENESQRVARCRGFLQLLANRVEAAPLSQIALQLESDMQRCHDPALSRRFHEEGAHGLEACRPAAAGIGYRIVLLGAAA